MDCQNDAKLKFLFAMSFEDLKAQNDWIEGEWGEKSGRNILDNLAIDWNSAHKGMGVSSDLKNWVLDHIDQFNFTDEQLKSIANTGNKVEENDKEVAKPPVTSTTAVTSSEWAVGDKVSGNTFHEGIIRAVFPNGSVKICYSDETKAYNWITLTKDETAQLLKIEPGMEGAVPSSNQTKAPSNKVENKIMEPYTGYATKKVVSYSATGTLADLIAKNCTANENVEVRTATGWIDRKITLTHAGLAVLVADGSKELMTLSLSGLTVRRSPGIVHERENVFVLSMAASNDPTLDVYINARTAADADAWVTLLNSATTVAPKSFVMPMTPPTAPTTPAQTPETNNLPRYRPNANGPTVNAEPEPEARRNEPNSDTSSVYQGAGMNRANTKGLGNLGDMLDDKEFPVGTEVICSFPTKKGGNGFFGTGKLKMDVTLKGRVVGYTGGLLLVMVHGEAKPRKTHRSWVHKKKIPAHLQEQEEPSEFTNEFYEDFYAPPIYGEGYGHPAQYQEDMFDQYHDPAQYRTYEPPRQARPAPVQEQIVYHQPVQQQMPPAPPSVVAPASHRHQDTMSQQGVAFHPSVRQQPYPDSFAQPDLPSWA